MKYWLVKNNTITKECAYDCNTRYTTAFSTTVNGKGSYTISLCFENSDCQDFEKVKDTLSTTDKFIYRASNSSLEC